MTRNEWVFLGLKLMGIWLLVEAVSGIPLAFGVMGQAGGPAPSNVAIIHVVTWLLRVGLGMIFVFRTLPLVELVTRFDPRD